MFETVFDILYNAPEEERRYYVYMWFRIENEEWIPFYIGKGTKDRWKNKSTRSKIFKDYLSKYNDCRPMIIWDNLTDEVALIAERYIKSGLKERGFQLIDAEDDIKERKKRQAEGIAAKKVRGEWGDYGRPKVEINNLDDYRRMIVEGYATVTGICKELGISRATWYKRVKEKIIHEGN